ncbi:MAG: hypothetical protein P4L81_01915 [Candidatus Pacebacteria bacterium]|nr:hypothetical protein [Candidatus Paceibacterota bacterium]
MNEAPQKNSVPDSLLRVIEDIEPFDPHKAVNQLEFASGVIKRSQIDASLAGALKIAFMSKVGQIIDGHDELSKLASERWITDTCNKLDEDVGHSGVVHAGGVVSRTEPSTPSSAEQ